jgi:hypothetical protein
MVTLDADHPHAPAGLGMGDATHNDPGRSGWIDE